jgi:hypothetical protein
MHHAASRRAPDDTRLDRLRALAGRLERLPASAERDWVIKEVRARAADVETGDASRAMRAFDAGAAAEVAKPRADGRRRERRPTPALTAPKPAAPVPGPSLRRPELSIDGAVVSLEQSVPGDGQVRAWTRGLRG